MEDKTTTPVPVRLEKSLEKIIVNVCKKHNVRAMELDTKHLSIISDCMEEYAAQSAPKESAGVEDWISVDDKMPEYNLGVLVFIPEEDFHITSGMWDIENKWVLLDEYRTVGEGEGMENCKVTHWMKMPDYPEGYEYPTLPKELVDAMKEMFDKQIKENREQRKNTIRFPYGK